MTKNPKRPVARRACLACREKKIKCDGEPISSIVTIDGSNKIIPQTTRTCTNCNLVGIECIFVQSNRGGRRKKNTSSEVSSNMTFKKSKSDVSTPEPSPSAYPFTSIASPNKSVPSIDEYEYKTHKVSRLDSDDMPSINGNIIPAANGNSAPNNVGHNFHPSPIPHGLPPLHLHVNLGHPEMASQLFQPATLPMHPTQSYHYYQTDKPISWNSPRPGSGSTPLPSWSVYHKGVASAPPTVLPGYQNFENYQLNQQSIGPQSTAVSDTYSNSGDLMNSGETKSRFSFERHSKISNVSRRLPPLDKVTNSAVVLPGIKSFKNSPKFQSKDNLDASSSESESPKPTTTKLVSNQDLPAEDPFEQMFSDLELAKYELPKWKTLNELIDLYYRFQHPNHQLLSSKHIFLSRLSLNSDSSLLHVILLNVCLITDDDIIPNFDIVHDEEFWLQKVYKYMDDLNNLGILMCYVLLTKSSIIRFNLPALNEINVKMWEIISSNNYLEIYSVENYHHMGLTSRQAYEVELVIRVLWNFYINNLVLLRLNQGYPYLKLSMIVNEKQFDYEISKKIDKVIMPNKKYFSSYKIERKDVSSEAEIHEGTVTAMVGKRLESVLNGISENNLVDDKPSDVEQSVLLYMEENYYEIKHDHKLIIINASLFLSYFVSKTSNLLKYLYFLMHIMNFKLFKNEYINTKDTFILPLISDVTIGNLANFEDFPKVIDDLNEEKFNQLISLIKVTFEIIKMIESNFNIPNQTTNIDDYSVVFGPCHIDKEPIEEWWKNKKSYTTIERSWYRYTEFSLVSSCAALSVLASLIVLTKFIRLIDNQGKLDVELFSSGTIKHFNIEIDSQLIKEFTLEILQRKLNQIIRFIKVRLRCYHKQVTVNTVIKMDKITHYLEEILNNIK